MQRVIASRRSFGGFDGTNIYRRRVGALARLLGLLVAACALLGPIAGCGGGAGPTVVVDVAGAPASALALRFAATLGGQSVRPVQDLTAGQRQVVYPLPSGSSGAFAVDVRALDDSGCASATGHGEATVSGSGRIAISVNLQAQNPALCTVEVATNGAGVITSNPTGLTCGTQCRLDAPAGTRITLAATAALGSFFAGWSGACAGIGTCDVTVTRPLSAQARFVPQLCTAGKVCWENPLPIDVNWNGIWGFASDNVWVVGDGGQIAHWDGKAWTLQPTVVARNLNSVWGASPTDIWAVGELSTLLHYDGTQWTQATAPVAGLTLYAVRGSSATDVWVTAGATILRYNGTWSMQAGAPIGNLVGLYVAADGTALVSSTSGTLSRWNGSGFATVTTLSTGAAGISGLAGNDVVLGGDLNIVGTFDGQTYRALSPYPSVNSLHGVHYRAPNDAWLVGTDGAVLHYDGLALIRQPVPATSYLNGVYALSATDVWVVGQRGTLLHYDGAAWTAYGRPSDAVVSPLNAVSGTGPKDLWAVGGTNYVVHNTGQGWIPVPTGQPATVDYSGVYAASATDVWVVGRNTATAQPVVLHWTGTTFNAETVPVATTLNAVGGAGPGVVYIVGAGTTFLRWNGSAFVSVGVTPAISSNLLTVTASSATDIWAAGTSIPDPVTSTPIACVLKFNGTGNAGVVRPLPNVTLYGASAPSSNEVVFVGNDTVNKGTMLRFVNGAFNMQVDLSAYPGLRAVSNVGGGEIWISGLSGTILRATDGQTFTKLDAGLSTQTLFGIAAFPSTAVAVGTGRDILRISL